MYKYIKYIKLHLSNYIDEIYSKDIDVYAVYYLEMVGSNGSNCDEHEQSVIFIYSFPCMDMTISYSRFCFFLSAQ